MISAGPVLTQTYAYTQAQTCGSFFAHLPSLFLSLTRSRALYLNAPALSHGLQDPIDNSAIVKTLIRNSPADKSGLIKPGDILFEVDGTNVYRESLDVVALLLLGEPGTSVRLLFLRGTRIFIEASIEREKQHRQSDMEEVLRYAQSLKPMTQNETNSNEQVEILKILKVQPFSSCYRHVRDFTDFMNFCSQWLRHDELSACPQAFTLNPKHLTFCLIFASVSTHQLTTVVLTY